MLGRVNWRKMMRKLWDLTHTHTHAYTHLRCSLQGCGRRVVFEVIAPSESSSFRKFSSHPVSAKPTHVPGNENRSQGACLKALLMYSVCISVWSHVWNSECRGKTCETMASAIKTDIKIWRLTFRWQNFVWWIQRAHKIQGKCVFPLVLLSHLCVVVFFLHVQPHCLSGC